jgi:hypothetical protein
MAIQRTATLTLMSREIPFSLSEDQAEFHTLDPRGEPVTVSLQRDPLTASLLCPSSLSSHAIAHPYLTFAAAIAHRWLGTNALHAGAFVTDDGAWAVLGSRESGKSTLLAQMAIRRLGIVADDLVAVRQGRVLAGPRSIDLRAAAAQHLEQGRCLDSEGMPERWRIEVPQVAGETPLRGWILPEWGDEVDLSMVAALERFPILCANLFLTQVPTNVEQLLELAALPCVRFRRPRDWDHADKATDALLDHLGQCR